MFYLRTINDGTWKVCAPASEDGSCEFLEQLQALEAGAKTAAVPAGLFALWDRIERVGPRALGTDLYHCIDEQNEIYEFIKGRYRALCFVGNGRLIVCSELHLKKTQKAPKSEKARAVALRKRYLEALDENAVTFFE